jgi:hypothetical protein
MCCEAEQDHCYICFGPVDDTEDTRYPPGWARSAPCSLILLKDLTPDISPKVTLGEEIVVQQFRLIESSGAAPERDAQEKIPDTGPSRKRSHQGAVEQGQRYPPKRAGVCSGQSETFTVRRESGSSPTWVTA